MNRPAILVGLPGSGKTTVGRRLLEMEAVTEFTDLDEAVEREAGCSVAEIFARWGEPAFRRREREAMNRALARPPHLIAAGAGWIAGPGNLDAALARDALVIHLRVTPELAAGRLGGDATRPLLAPGDPLARLRRLFEERRNWYERAAAQLDASGPPEAVAEAVIALIGPG